MSDKSIIETVLGRSSLRLHGWGRDLVSSSSTTCATKKSKLLAYEEPWMLTMSWWKNLEP
ncbi:hypothetical protein Hanom_Chr16g01479481 [Helianthus anomalus]